MSDAGGWDGPTGEAAGSMSESSKPLQDIQTSVTAIRNHDVEKGFSLESVARGKVIRVERSFGSEVAS